MTLKINFHENAPNSFYGVQNWFFCDVTPTNLNKISCNLQHFCQNPQSKIVSIWYLMVHDASSMYRRGRQSLGKFSGNNFFGISLKFVIVILLPLSFFELIKTFWATFLKSTSRPSDATLAYAAWNPYFHGLQNMVGACSKWAFWCHHDRGSKFTYSLKEVPFHIFE